MSKAEKKFGKKGFDARFKEFDQLHKRTVFQPKKVSELSEEEKKKALESLIFIKEKRDGMLKGRTCADGRKQCSHVKKEDAASPTVSLEAVLLTCVMEAKEERDVAIINIPNVFVQMDWTGEKVIMKLRRRLAEFMMRTSSGLYSEYVTMENGKAVLYLEDLKAIYRCLQSALLFYLKLKKDLESVRFVLNPYGPCIANKVIGGKQMTICWHVDNIKASHKSSKVVDKFIQWLKDKYEEKDIGRLKAT